MNKPILTVTKFEIIRQLKKPAFWIAILLMPIMLGGIFLISFMAGSNARNEVGAEYENQKIAITDEAGVLPVENPFALYGEKDDGIAAVKSGDLDLYYYIPSDFTETKTAEFYHISEGLGIFDNSADILRGILSEFASSKVSALDATVLTGNYEIEEVKLTADGEDANVFGKAIIPLAILAIFFIFVCIFGNRLIMTVIEEKENRISEMILTAVSAKHLIIGKIIALMTLGIIQVLTLVIPIAIIVFVNRDNTVVSSVLGIVELSPFIIITNLILFVFSILLFSGFCTFIGAITPTARDASQFIGPVIIGVMFPFYFMQAFMATEPSFMVYFCTYFPLSAPTAMMLRNAMGSLNTTELLIGLAEIIALAVVAIRLTINTFQKNAINFAVVKPKFLRRGK